MSNLPVNSDRKSGPIPELTIRHYLISIHSAAQFARADKWVDEATAKVMRHLFRWALAEEYQEPTSYEEFIGSLAANTYPYRGVTAEEVSILWEVWQTFENVRDNQVDPEVQE